MFTGNVRKIDEEVLATVKKAHGIAKKILEENRAKLDELAAYLLERRNYYR